MLSLGIESLEKIFVCLIIATLLNAILYLYAHIIKLLLHGKFIMHLAESVPDRVNLTAALIEHLQLFIHVLFVFYLASPPLVINFLMLLLKLHLFAV